MRAFSFFPVFLLRFLLLLLFCRPLFPFLTEKFLDDRLPFLDSEEALTTSFDFLSLIFPLLTFSKTSLHSGIERTFLRDTTIFFFLRLSANLAPPPSPPLPDRLPPWGRGTRRGWRARRTRGRSAAPAARARTGRGRSRPRDLEDSNSPEGKQKKNEI